MVGSRTIHSSLGRQLFLKTCMMSGWVTEEKVILGVLQGLLQLLAMDVELTEEIHSDVMAKMILMVGAVGMVVAVEDM